MKSYGQFCPLAQATQLLCERWTLIVVRELLAGSTRFNELKKGVPSMSPTLLSTRLRQLTESGVIERSGSPGDYSYELTQAGRELKPVVELLGAWGHRWARSNLSSNDLDAGLLMWDMRRSVNPGVFPYHRIVVQFEYPDAPAGARDWWLVSEQGTVELCLSDPNYDVSVHVRCPLKVMTQVWICEREFNEAVRSGDIKLSGDPKLIAGMHKWLQSSALSRLGLVEPMPDVAWAEA